MKVLPHRRIIYWIKNDQRIHDNEALHLIANADTILPVYIIDPTIENKKVTYYLMESEITFNRIGDKRKKFVFESLLNLQQEYKNINSKLFIYEGDTATILEKIALEMQADAIVTEEEITEEEIKLIQKVAKKCNLPVILYTGKFLYHPEDIPFHIDKIPDVYTEFRKKVERVTKVRPVYATPTALPNVAEINSIEQWNTTLEINPLDVYKGGEKYGLERLKYYLFDSQLIQHYKYTRNGLLGLDYSSKFSLWLANGNLSPRTIFYAIEEFEEKINANESTYWLIFELIWRDYFKYISSKYGTKFFHKGGIKGLAPYYKNSIFLLYDWLDGTTNQPFVNANMKELAATGYMSNRGRQNVASYLCKDLKIDWRIGASYFEMMLIDYDPCSNWGNWMYIAGVGNDPREDRYFNIPKQAAMYDSNGEYVKYWLNK